MDKKTIAAAVGAVMLTAGAGATTWAVVFDQQPPVATAISEPIVTTVYVDQFGNLLDPASLAAEAPVDEVVLEPVPMADQTAANELPVVEQAAYKEHEEAEYEGGEYEEEEHEEHEEHEEEEHEG